MDSIRTVSSNDQSELEYQRKKEGDSKYDAFAVPGYGKDHHEKKSK